jgi:hypothetical protein
MDTRRPPHLGTAAAIARINPRPTRPHRRACRTGHAGYQDAISQDFRILTPQFPVVDLDDDLQDMPRGRPLTSHDEMIRAAARIAVDDQQVLEELWMGPQESRSPKVASTVALWEVPGTLCQMAAIKKIADNTSMKRFADWFFEYGPRRYRTGFQLTVNLVSSQSDPGRMREWLALVAWSQMGRYTSHTDFWRSSPVFRLSRLLEAYNGGLRWRGDEPFLELVSLWDETVGQSSLDDLHDSTRELARLVDRSAQNANQSGNAFARSGTSDALQEYYRAHLVMKEIFLRDPDRFIDPVAYLDHQDDYP